MDEDRALQVLLKLDPQSPIPIFTMGRYHFKCGRYQEALACFTKSLELDADYLLGYLLCGQSYEKLNDAKRARQLYQQGLERARALHDARFEQQFSALAFTAL